MVVRDEDFGAALTLAQESDGTWSPSEAVPSREPRDWRLRFEQERARADRERERADAAEARLSEAAVESAKRRKVVPSSGQVSRLQKENARLCKEAARLDKRLAREAPASESHKETIRTQNREIIRLVAELRRLRDQKDTVKRLSEEGLPAALCPGRLRGHEGTAEGTAVARDRGCAVEVAAPRCR